MSLLLALGVTAQPRAGSSTQHQRIPARQQLDLSFYAINIALLAPRTPFSQRDWPNRALQRPLSFATADVDRTYAPVTTPFAQDDWPNPQRARVNPAFHVAPTNLGLLRPDVNPAKQYDWPNPQLARRAPDFIAQTNLGLLRPDVTPAKQYDWPNPRLGWRNPDYLASTNLGLLRPDVNPFSQDDWPNQLRASWRLSDWSQQGIRAVVVVQPPFAQYDWPNSLAARRSVDLISWISTYAFEAPVVVTNPFSQRDWPNRFAPRPLSFATSDADRTYAPVVVAGTPFAQTSWPNPRGSVNLAGYQKFTDYITLEIIPPEGNQRNWPNPRGARAVNLAASNPNRAYAVTVVVTGDPIRPIEWANPQGRPDLSRYQKFTDSLSFVIVPVTDTTTTIRAPTFAPTWQPYRVQGWIQSASVLTLPAITNPPIRQYDWPNPRGAARSIDLYDWIQALSAINLPAIVNPLIRQFDWPNPPAARNLSRYQKFEDHLSFFTNPPVRQYDWPNTPAARRTIHFYSWVQAYTALNLPAPVGPPIAQFDWPNPRGAARGIDLYGWIKAFSALDLPLIINPPIRQYDWPNPKGPLQPIIRYGWQGPLTALNLPIVIPPVEVLQPGGEGVPHTFSRKRWRELQMLIAAEMAAVAKAERLTKADKREPLLKAARAAAAAVDAAEAEGENARLDKLLVRNAETIRRAIRAATAVKQAREVASAIEQSRAIVLRQKEDEEDEMIALLMMS